MQRTSRVPFGIWSWFLVILVHSKIGKDTRIDFERLVGWNGRQELIPVHIEDNIFEFFLGKEVTST